MRAAAISTLEPAEARLEEREESEMLLSKSQAVSSIKLREHRVPSRESRPGSGHLPPSPLSGRTDSRLKSTGKSASGQSH